MTIAQRLEHLFQQTAGKGRPVTLQDVIDKMNERGISSMSLSYLQQLRNGKAHNPRLQHLRALADAFDVPLSYFLDDDSQTGTDSEVSLTPQEQAIALRAHGLSDSALESIRAIVELARKSERLDEPPQ